jgi:glycosyltransferase involved in cell wall biosynthesis
MNRTFRFSVIIPTYNRAAVLPRAIESALTQTLPTCEVIVVDDGSTDATPAVVTRYGRRIRCIRQENAGAAAARNCGIEAAAGDWLAFLDSDDEWLPEKLARQAQRLETFSHLGWCACGSETCEGPERRPSTLPHAAAWELARTGYFEDYFTAASRGVRFPTPGMVVETRLAKEVGGFDAQLTEAEDLDLWGRIALLAPAIGYVPEPCFRIYPTAGSLSQAGRREKSLSVSMRNTARLAAGRSREQADRYRRYAQPRAFHMLLKAAAKDGEVDAELVRTLEAEFPPSRAQEAILSLIRRVPHGLARRLEWRIRDWHTRLCER